MISLAALFRESGLASVYATGGDAWIIILSRSCRMFAYGSSALLLALFFAELDVPDERIGLFMTLTLAGDVALSLLLTLVADHVGRRRTLLFGSVLMIISGTTFALCENYWLLLAAAVVGVISATGSDFGPFRAVEESMLSEVTSPATRSDVLVWYVTTSALGSAIGSEVAGHAVQSLHNGPLAWPLLSAYHACYWAYAAMGVVNLLLSLLLSERTELRGGVAEHGSESIPMTPASVSSGADGDEEDKGDGDGHESEDGHGTAAAHTAPAPPPKSRLSQISKETRAVMYGLWFLLMVDSLADGMASMALTTYYMDSKFHMGKDSLGTVLSVGYLLAAVSSIFAGPLARYIGLINTMVFTHAPSSAAVLLFPLPRSVGLTYALLLLRIGLNNLDQAPRAALIAAVVRPHERTAVMGITNMLRTLASTTGPTLTGLLAGHDRFWIAFVVAGALRLAYDFGLFAMFVNIRLYQHEPVAADGGGAGTGSSRRGDGNGDYSAVPGHPDAFVLDEEESIEGEGDGDRDGDAQVERR